jgi:hypothetical protein
LRFCASVGSGVQPIAAWMARRHISAATEYDDRSTDNGLRCRSGINCCEPSMNGFDSSTATGSCIDLAISSICGWSSVPSYAK